MTHRTKVPGTLYLIHFAMSIGNGTPIGSARHYLGWTEGNVAERLEEHRHGRGAAIMRAVAERFIPFWVVRTWEGVTRDEERRVKKWGAPSRLCPVCNAPARRVRFLEGRITTPRTTPEACP